jgi:hypothetical protein
LKLREERGVKRDKGKDREENGRKRGESEVKGRSINLEVVTVADNELTKMLILSRTGEPI